MGKEIVNQVQGVKRVPYRINPKRNTPRQILIKLTKIKHQKKTIKSSKGNPICLTAYLSAETLQVRRGWQDIFKVLKGKNLQLRLLYLARIAFKIDGEIKSLTDKQKLRECSTTKPAFQQMVKALI